jgi:hypothetical protein
MPADRTRSLGFALRVAFAIVAMAVQTLIPLVVAGDIAAVAARDFSICAARGHPAPLAPAGQHGRRGAGGTSPISAALAAAGAFTTPAQIPVPVPAGWRPIRLSLRADAAGGRAPALAFRARGPPRAA